MGYTSRRNKLCFPCSAASVAAHFAPLFLLFPQNLVTQSFAGALKVIKFLLAVLRLLLSVWFHDHGGLIVFILLITFLQIFYFSIYSYGVRR